MYRLRGDARGLKSRLTERTRSAYLVWVGGEVLTKIAAAQRNNLPQCHLRIKMKTY